MKQATFTINERQYKGWHDPEVRWNGFAVPYFDQMTALLIVGEQGFPYVITDDATIHALDPVTGDKYEWGRDDSDALYSIGGFEWAWEIEEETE